MQILHLNFISRQRFRCVYLFYLCLLTNASITLKKNKNYSSKKPYEQRVINKRYET